MFPREGVILFSRRGPAGVCCAAAALCYTGLCPWCCTSVQCAVHISRTLCLLSWCTWAVRGWKLVASTTVQNMSHFCLAASRSLWRMPSVSQSRPSSDRLWMKMKQKLKRFETWGNPSRVCFLIRQASSKCTQRIVCKLRECHLSRGLPVAVPCSAPLTVVLSNMLHLHENNRTLMRNHSGACMKMYREGRVLLLAQNVESQGPYPL